MKTIGKILLVIVILVIAALGGVTYYLDSIAKTAIEYGGSEALGVATTVDKLHISLMNGSSSINGLTIANPQGFTQQNFIQLKHAKIAVNIQSITSDTIHITEISLAGLHLNLEQSNQDSNVKALMANLPQTSDKAASTPTSKNSTTHKTTTSNTRAKKFIADKITLSDIGVTARIQALGAKLKDVNLTIAQLQLANVGKAQGGMTMPELIHSIIAQVLDAVAKNSTSISPALASMLKGDLTSVAGLKAGVQQVAAGKVDKATKKLLKKLKIPAGDNAELQQAASNLVNGLFNSK